MATDDDELLGIEGKLKYRLAVLAGNPLLQQPRGGFVAGARPLRLSLGEKYLGAVKMRQPTGGVQIDGLPKPAKGLVVVSLMPGNDAQHQAGFKAERVALQYAATDGRRLVVARGGQQHAPLQGPGLHESGIALDDRV